MTRAKPTHAFRVRLVREGREPSYLFLIRGDSFFAARADFCRNEMHEGSVVHQDEVRPVPTGDGCRVRETT